MPVYEPWGWQCGAPLHIRLFPGVSTMSDDISMLATICHGTAWATVLQTLGVVRDVTTTQKRDNWLALLTGRIHESKSPIDVGVYTGARYLVQCILDKTAPERFAFDMRVMNFARRGLDANQSDAAKATMNVLANDLPAVASEAVLDAFERLVADVEPGRDSCELLLTHYMNLCLEDGHSEAEKEQVMMCLSIVGAIIASPLSADDAVKQIRACVHTRRTPNQPRAAPLPDITPLLAVPQEYRGALLATAAFASELPGVGIRQEPLDVLRAIMEQMSNKRKAKREH